MPAMSTHSQLARTMFREHGVEPGNVIEADQESLIANLVVSGVGVSLLPDPLALDLQTAGQVCIWEKAVLRGTLWFVYLRNAPTTRSSRSWWRCSGTPGAGQDRRCTAVIAQDGRRRQRHPLDYRLDRAASGRPPARCAPTFQCLKKLEIAPVKVH